MRGCNIVVDATQGIQAQTLANVYQALENNLHIIPVVNKIDMSVMYFMLFFLLYLIDYKKLEPIWLSLATSVRFDFGLYLAYVFICKLKEKDFQRM